MDWTTFRVPGRPVPQGSKRVVRTKGGKTVMLEQGGDRLYLWRASVRLAAADLFDAPVEAYVPVQVRLDFYFARPRDHYGTGRNAGVVKPGAPAFPIGGMSGDVDKLTRACLDAMTGCVYADDSQVIALVATKNYADDENPEGMKVKVGLP